VEPITAAAAGTLALLLLWTIWHAQVAAGLALVAIAALGDAAATGRREPLAFGLLVMAAAAVARMVDEP